MPWVNARIIADAQQAEALGDALMEAGALSVTVEDADAGTPAETPQYGEPGMETHTVWNRSVLSALFNADEPVRDIVATCAAALGVEAALTIEDVPETDWVRATQAQFDPIPIGGPLWIVPTWHEPPAQAKKVIRLDPGLAFGTGTHPTTRMCLRWIATHDVAQQRVLDYGCGSGILAIGAALHGASAIDAVDIDEAAVTATELNAEANHVRLNAGLPDKASGQYQTVLANILATPLKVLAPLLRSHVAAGGHLVLAGILERQAQELQDAYAPYCTLQVSDREDGWILMTAHC